MPIHGVRHKTPRAAPAKLIAVVSGAAGGPVPFPFLGRRRFGYCGSKNPEAPGEAFPSERAKAN